MWQSESIQRILRYGAVVAATAVAVSATPAPAQETYELSGDPAAVWNLAGAVNVTGGGSALTVEVRRGGADAGQLELATGAIDLDSDGVRRVDALRVVYPGDEIAYSGGSTELHVRDESLQGTDEGAAIGRSPHLAQPHAPVASRVAASLHRVACRYWPRPRLASLCEVA